MASAAALTARKLLHWVNSLPIADCLFVDDLSELRKGQALVEIAKSLGLDLNAGDAMGRCAAGPHAKSSAEATRAVVAFAARHCRSVDGNAVFTLNESHCADRVAHGDCHAIAAVLTVLRRLHGERVKRARMNAEGARELAKTESVRALKLMSEMQSVAAIAGVEMPSRQVEMTLRSTRAADPGHSARLAQAGRPRAKQSEQMAPKTATPKDTGDRPHISAPTKALPNACEAADRRDRYLTHKEARRDQPRTRQSLSASPAIITGRAPEQPAETQLSKDQGPSVKEVLTWMESLGVAVPWNELGNNPAGKASLRAWSKWFADGVALCRLAGAIGKRRGSMATKCKLVSLHDGTLVPRGTAIPPHTQAQQLRNLELAWGILIECRAITMAPFAKEEAAFCSTFSSMSTCPSTYQIAWRLLQDIREHCMPRLHVTDDHDAHDRTVINAIFPIVTSEQHRAVQRWLRGRFKDVRKFGDALRNGVALSAAMRQAFPDLARDLNCDDMPATTQQARQRVTRVLRILRKACSDDIPHSYFTTNAGDRIVAGDLQVIEGLLAHVLRHCEPPTAETPPPAPSPAPEAVTTPTQSIPSPLLLDVPASVLAGHGHAPPWIELPQDDDIIPHPVHYVVDIVPTVRRVPDACVTRPASPPRPAVKPRLVETQCPVDAPEHRDPARSPRKQSPTPTSPVPVGSPTRVHVFRMSNQTIDAILHWLKRLNVRIQHAAAFYDPNGRLSEFASGELLCQIAEKVEIRRSIEGVCHSKQGVIARAHALHNINKALAIFQQKPTIPRHVLRSQIAIASGDRQPILLLLDQIRRAYGYHRRIKPCKIHPEPPPTRVSIQHAA